MFSTFKLRLLLGIYVFILLSIPVGAYLASQNQIFQSTAKEEKKTKKNLPLVTPKPLASPASPAKQLLSQIEEATEPSPTEEPSPSDSSPTIATNFGPTLTLKIKLEGRPENNQSARIFVGIAEGTLTSNPKFVLSFTVDLPASGEYSGLSLAGLNSGSPYTALIKGPAQIAAATAFTMSPAITNLNSGETINLISGDLNDDNVINSSDLTIAQKAAGATSESPLWNENADLTKDGVINAFDLGIISKNIGKTGDSGAWTSPLPQIATPSANLSEPAAIGGTSKESPGGYWIWIPK